MAALAYVLDDPEPTPIDPAPSPASTLQRLAIALARRREEERMEDAGPPVDDEELDRRASIGGALVRQMIETPATDFAGLRAKATGAVWCMGEEQTLHDFHAAERGSTYDEVVYSIICDLIAPEGESRAPIASPSPVLLNAPEPSRIATTAKKWLAEQAAMDEAWERWTAAIDAATSLHPEPPEILRDQVTNAVHLDRDHYARLDCRARIARAIPMTAGPRVEAFDIWKAQMDAIDTDHHIPALEAEVDRRTEAGWQAAHELAALVPQTIQEAMVKYGVMLAAFGDRGGGPREREPSIDQARPFFRFLQDLEHLARRG